MLGVFRKPWGGECDEADNSCSAATAQVPQGGGFSNRHWFLPVPEARSLPSKCWQDWFFWGLSLADRWLSFLCLHLVFLCVGVLISSSCKDTSCIGWGPTLVASFNPNYLFQGQISKYSWHLRKKDLNRAGPLIHGLFFSKNFGKFFGDLWQFEKTQQQTV